MDIYSTGAPGNGAVGIGMGTGQPLAPLDVVGGVRGSGAAVVLNGSCSPEGMLGYDLSNHQPVYCNGSKWTQLNSAPQAWVNFDGTNCPSGWCAIRGSKNVASVFRYATGAYAISFLTPLANANYSVSGSATDIKTNYGGSTLRPFSYSPDGSSAYVNVAPTVNGFVLGLIVEGYLNGVDADYVMLSIDD
jgi:hypothetical protein